MIQSYISQCSDAREDFCKCNGLSMTSGDDDDNIARDVMMFSAVLSTKKL